MNTNEINAILKGRCESFLGTFPSNHLPEGHGWAVINLDDSTKSGSHWVVVGGRCEYFDSFGLLPLTNSILQYLKKRCTKGWWFNNIPLQSPNSIVCGHFCVYYILMRCKGHSPSSIIKKLSSISRPDQFVYNYVMSLP